VRRGHALRGVLLIRDSARYRNQQLSSIIQTVIDAGTRNGWMSKGIKAPMENDTTTPQSMMPLLSLQDWHTYDPDRSSSGRTEVLSISNEASS
jgi:hypothetical protein